MKKPPSKEYLSYINSPAWDEKRKERLALDGYTCQDCGVNGCALDVHHLNYKRFRHEPMSDLVTVCRRCHNYRHGKYYVSFLICPTCLQFLPITIQKIRLLRHDIMRLICADGHVTTYNDDDQRAASIKRLR